MRVVALILLALACASASEDFLRRGQAAVSNAGEALIFCDCGSSGTECAVFEADGSHKKCGGGAAATCASGTCLANKKITDGLGFPHATPAEDETHAENVGKSIINACKLAMPDEAKLKTLPVQAEATAGMRYFEHVGRNAAKQWEKMEAGYKAGGGTGTFKGKTLAGVSEGVLGLCGVAKVATDKNFAFMEIGGASIQEGFCVKDAAPSPKLLETQATMSSAMRLRQQIQNRAEARTKGDVHLGWLDTCLGGGTHKCYVQSQNGNAGDRMLYNLLRLAIKTKRERETTGDKCVKTHCISNKCTLTKTPTGVEWNSATCKCENNANNGPVFTANDQWGDGAGDVTCIKGAADGATDAAFEKCQDEIREIYKGKQETGTSRTTGASYATAFGKFAAKAKAAGANLSKKLVISAGALFRGMGGASGKLQGTKSSTEFIAALKDQFKGAAAAADKPFHCSGMVVQATVPVTLTAVGFPLSRFTGGITTTKFDYMVAASQLPQDATIAYDPAVPKDAGDVAWESA